MRTTMRKIGYMLLVVMLFACCGQSGETPLVYITRTGICFHQETCSYLGRSKIPITLAEAREKGYTPCSRCFGEEAAPAPDVPRADTNEQTVTQARRASQRCTAITKKGTRCKRTTTNPSGHCWQHEQQ